MSGRILRFPDPHQTVDELLPWYVNGTLDGEELALVERHVAECPRCQQEVGALRQFQAAYADSEMAPDPAASLGKLLGQMNVPKECRRQRWSMRWLLGIPLIQPFSATTWQFRRWAPWALVAELAVILILAGMLLSGGESQPLYRTLGAAAPSPQEMGRLVVVFDPQVTEAELRRIVRSSGARIVDGPTVGDAYVLEVPAERQTAALQVLRGQRVVTLAERLNSGVAP